MEQKERRKHKRVNINYPITYCCLDSDGSVIEEMMGVALNISQSGILIESVSIVTTKDVLLVSVDLDKKVIQHRGKVAYCRKLGNGKFRTGISFNGTHDANVKFATKITKSYHYLKNVLHFDPSNAKRPKSFLN